MKKRIISLFLIILVSGCGSKEVITQCTLNNRNIVQDYELNAEYNIYSKNDIVGKVVTIESITSNNDELLDEYKEYIEETYSEYNKTYGGYDYDVDIEGNKLTAVTEISYGEMNLEKFVKDNSSMKKYIKDNKLTLKGSLDLYQSLGAECK